ncbi:MAG: DPP IV N-terminal domain-containing protein [Gemmatimonadota bacterium]|nr:DPP IV N-terminal domain-containing protein [Gemmatimonadota bacterium]MDQ8174109.1 DPP IV N-terminal domain-containing protein [Gemmatimonadota bacterium]MDQ8178959.1 DPP IV N-terminal domain-containing protein [Gemmatimonadota bacterium]
MSPRFALSLVALVVLSTATHAQDRLRAMPGYERYAAMAPKLASSLKSGAITPQWADDGSSFEFTRDGKRFRYTVATKMVTEAGPLNGGAGMGARRMNAPARGRQYTEAWTADSAMKAVYRDNNLFISARDGSGERQLTTDGSKERRIKYGTASWVYGEELDQVTAMWWSPNGKQLAYYRFDENPVKDYWLQMDQTAVQGAVMIEAYPKAGTQNPIVDLFVYDQVTGKTVRIDARDGKPLTDEVVGHYVYGITWSPDGSELLLRRTNRRQNVMEFAACSPTTGACRVLVREEWLASWTENSPTIRWLADGKRFIWESERTGFKNYYLYDLSGKRITPLTQHSYEVAGIVKVDEEAKQLWYYARSGDNFMKLQLHRVGLDGKGDRRLTDPAVHHTVTVAPNGRHFVDVAQSHAIAPVTRVLDAAGKMVATVAESDLSAFTAAGFRAPEMFTYTAADGTTPLYGMLHKPSNFDPSKRYPVLFSVYAGPATNGAREVFGPPMAWTEMGFLVVTLDTRSAAGRGKRALDAIYEKLGEVEIDDLAAASRHLAKLPFVDGQRVGIFGTSYGGYASALALLRHPDAFHAASASSSVTSWHHYDTIYTERYMYTPQANPEGYKKGNAMEYAANLRGRLMIFYGTADDNVHPNNSMQLIQALQRAGKHFEVQVGPDVGHASINQQRMMEFFIQSLVLER